ncbi:MAG: Gfo/Idh/MocA family oxidoreductase [Thermoguttaceae bacterium]
MPSLDERPAGQPRGDFSRRDFIKGGIVGGAVAAGSMGAFYFGYGAAEGHPIRVGVLGTGDEGSVLLGAINPEYVEVKAIADIRPYNVWRAFHGDQEVLGPRPGLMSVYGWKTETEARRHVKVYSSGYQELLGNAKADGLEAIIIALPLHLHAPAAIAAMKAGLHVLTEKLMGHSVHECKEMSRVAAQTHRHLATGHQRHYNILYEDAMDTIRRGVLGDLHYIRAQWHRGNMPGSDSWQMPMPKELKPKDDQAAELERELASWRAKLQSARGRDIDVWAKKVAQKEMQLEDQVLKTVAKEQGYEDRQYKAGGTTYDRPAAEELIRWRLWQRTGGGLMAELGSHQLDASSIFISAMHGGKKQHPIRVMCASNRPIFGLDREADDHVCCIYEFPALEYSPDPKSPDNRKRIGVQYASINGNGFGGYGEIVYGTKGTLILEREQEVKLYRDESASKVKTSSGPAALDTQASGAAQKAAAASGPVNVSRGYREEIEHWAWCVRVNPNNTNPDIQPRCYPKVAMADAVIALTTNIAAESGKPIHFEESWFDPDSDETPEGVAPDLSRYA